MKYLLLIVLIALALVVVSGFIFFTPLIRNNFDPYGFIDRRGTQLINLKTKESALNDMLPTSFAGGFCRVFSPGKLPSESYERYFANYMDRSGKLLFKDFHFVEAREFSEGLAAVCKPQDDSVTSNMSIPRRNAAWVFIDTGGNVQCGPYKNVLNFSDGLAGVNALNTEYWQFVDHSGKVAISSKFGAVTAFKEGRASVRVNGKWGLIDKTGRTVILPQLPVSVGAFNEGFAPIIRRDKERVDYIDRNGDVKLSVHRAKLAGKKFIYFDSISHQLTVCESTSNGTNWTPEAYEEKVSEGLVVIEANGKYGFGDLAGNVIIKPCFDYCWPFSSGRALVYNENNSGGKFGYIAKTGQFIRPCEFVKAYSYSEGYAVASMDWRTDYFKYFDVNGTECFGREFPAAQPFHEGLAFVGKRTIWP